MASENPVEERNIGIDELQRCHCQGAAPDPGVREKAQIPDRTHERATVKKIEQLTENEEVHCQSSRKKGVSAASHLQLEKPEGTQHEQYAHHRDATT